MASEPGTFEPIAERSEPYAASPVSAGRVVRRFVVMLVALLAIDLIVRAAFPSVDTSGDWRLPETMPTSEMDAAIRKLDDLAEADAPTIAFVGASPAWGHAVRNVADTVPARVEDAARADGTSVAVVNLASNGQLPVDQYFVAKRAAQSADVVVVQLTYHSFNPEWRQGAVARYPELPQVLGVPVSSQAARLLDRSPTTEPDVTGLVDRRLRRLWALYGSRDRIAARVLGTSPESATYGAWEKAADPTFAGEDEQTPSGTPFEQLDPEAQMFILDEFSSAADYRVDPRDPEIRALDMMAAELRRDGRKAVFYLSPLNVDALRAAGLYDSVQVADNVTSIRRAVERHGYRFVDMSRQPLPSGSFADINHTTAAGSDIVARRLWRELADEVSAP